MLALLRFRVSGFTLIRRYLDTLIHELFLPLAQAPKHPRPKLYCLRVSLSPCPCVGLFSPIHPYTHTPVPPYNNLHTRSLMLPSSPMGLHSVIVGIRALILIPLSILILGSVATVLIFFRDGERIINGPVANTWARTVIWLAAARITVHGVGNIPSTGDSYIVVMNHQSNMDIPILVHSLPLQLRFIGKKELKKIPIFGSALIKAGHFLIDRGHHRKAMEGIKAAGKALRQRGVSVVFAPEGTRSTSSKLLTFKKGAFVMAIETGIPILPVTIDGTRNSLAKGSLWTRSADVIVQIHPPVPTASLSYGDRDELSEKIRSIMEKDLEERPVIGHQ